MANPEIAAFLMFTGQAEEAMNLYTSLFSRSEVVQVQRYGPENPSQEGQVMHAVFTLKGQAFRCIDSAPVHAFTFTPSISIAVVCDTDEELERAFAQLTENGGGVLMPLGVYPFSRKYAWVNDRFGVSWQLSME